MLEKKFFNLKNKIIIISGGYGHLGFQICKDLLSFDAKIFCLGRSQKKFKEKFSRELKKKKKIFFIKCDVQKENEVIKAINIIVKKEKKIDVLINNAINSNFRSISSNISLRNWTTNLKEVLQGYFLLSKHCAEIMKKNSYGKIINIASLFSFLAPIKEMHLDLKNEPPMSMAVGKGGILQMTKYLASILGEFNVNVNSISPGWFPKKKPNQIERKDYINEMNKRTPLKRIGKVDEVSGAIILLSSDKSSYITGQNIIIDGGYSIW